MKINLGYACNCLTLDKTASHTITYTHYKKSGINGDIKLDEIIRNNFNSLEEILKYNIANDVKFYRMTAELLPLSTHPNVNYDYFNKYKDNYIKIGNIIKKNKIRVDIHASQYSIINSSKSNVIDSTINILKIYQKMYKYMKIESKVVMHVGSSEGGKKISIKRFIDNFNNLDENLKSLIILENDDKKFNIRNVLKICELLNIPMVLDYHHYKINKNNEKIEDYIQRIFNTWKEVPKIHFSSPKDKKNKRSHNDYIDSDSFIDFIEKIKFTNRDFDVMIEAKKKDEALFKLIRELKYKTKYKIVGTTLFL